MGMGSRFKITSVEIVRDGTYKLCIDAGKDGNLRVLSYPTGPLMILSDTGVQWLDCDLSDKQRTIITRAVKRAAKSA